MIPPNEGSVYGRGGEIWTQPPHRTQKKWVIFYDIISIPYLMHIHTELNYLTKWIPKSSFGLVIMLHPPKNTSK